MTTLLLITPDFYDITYAINPHMVDGDGRPHTVDRPLARQQWNTLKSVYENLGCQVLAYPGKMGFPDMVFCANQTFPFIDPQGRRKVILSKMRHAERQGEVLHFKRFFESLRYETLSLPENIFFEGMGDLIFRKNRDGSRTYFGGFGFRTESKALEAVEKVIDSRIHRLELIDERFYHLDTCLCILNAETALLVREAFSPQALTLLESEFPNLISLDIEEALTFFSGNAYSPDGKNVVLQKGAVKTLPLLKEKDFFPVEVDTSEFIKAGGSVFCMKLELPLN